MSTTGKSLKDVVINVLAEKVLLLESQIQVMLVERQQQFDKVAELEQVNDTLLKENRQLDECLVKTRDELKDLLKTCRSVG